MASITVRPARRATSGSSRGRRVLIASRMRMPSGSLADGSRGRRWGGGDRSSGHAGLITRVRRGLPRARALPHATTGELRHLVGVDDAHRVELPQEPMASSRGGARHRTGYGPERPAQRGGMSCGVERAGTDARLEHHGRLAGRRDQAVPLQESPLRGRGSAWQFGDDGTGLRDAAEQRLVAERIEAVDAAGEEGDGRAVTGESRAVRHPVDPVGAARHDGEPAVDEPGRGFHRHVLAIARRGAGAHQGDRGHAPIEGVGSAAHPQPDRRVHAELVDPMRPARVTGHDQLRADPRGLRERADEVAVVETRPPAGETGLGLAFVEVAARGTHLACEPLSGGARKEGLGRRRRPDRRDDAPEHAVAGLCDDAERRASEGVERRRGLAPDGGELDRPLLRRSFDEVHIVIPFRRNRARPTCSAPGAEAPSRSAMVQAVFSTRS